MNLHSGLFELERIILQGCAHFLTAHQLSSYQLNLAVDWKSRLMHEKVLCHAVKGTYLYPRLGLRPDLESDWVKEQDEDDDIPHSMVEDFFTQQSAFPTDSQIQLVAAKLMGCETVHTAVQDNSAKHQETTVKVHSSDRQSLHCNFAACLLLLSS